MGSEAVRDLIKNTDVEAVTIAGRNLEAAERLACTLRSERVAVSKVDATDRADLFKVMQGHTVVASALGPFYRFERPLVEAVLEAGLSYVSICDDHDATASVLELDDLARQKGCKILTGLGWTPGLSNILARKGYDELSEVKSIRVYWAGSAGDAKGLAVILHTLHIFTGTATSFQNGSFCEVKAGSGEEAVEFLPPLGKINTYHLGHPEPVTLPRYLPGVREVLLKGGLVENYLNGLAKLVAALHLTNSARKKMRLGKLLKRLLSLFPVDQQRCLSGLRVEITGRRGGKAVKVSYGVVDHMNRLTGIPLSIGAYLMAKGEIERLGVYGPEAEGAVNPHRFLEELARRGVKIVRREEPLES